MTNTLYRENIMEHYRNPRNYGKLENPDLEYLGENLSCGDSLRFTLKMKKEKLDEIRFTGEACAISKAAASMLSEKILGIFIEDIMKIRKDDILKMLNIEIGPVRMKCALLPLESIQTAIRGKNDKSA
ncbi:MAG: iron-sulfur cluster assembly scaffold protein [archaeon]|jgi:nitrogen fixation NifU-like protein|nr:Fe-S cluster protein [Euryarchaeota archaeon]MDP7260630.1 iron-sulfur cluster assembly scaffold protein [archaeon]HIK01147.1 iron-sulfur cluster assembly scaffold protein [Candidatus Undinarchaeales archaeon ERR594346 U_76725]|tara:strand:+ start:82894 stop:83277 length:384 start_codon:yes stop_codon:yes gene_type:complete